MSCVFVTGLSYRTDMSTGECTISAINLGTFDINIPSSKNSDGQMLELKNPLQFFYLSNNFKYAGQVELDMVCYNMALEITQALEH